ncbi:hypothetical protein PVA38_10890 [Streptococcus pneumoniae D39]|nr:hypothetical protein PVA38_10890 [Streptococcus pneumoniae D39]
MYQSLRFGKYPHGVLAVSYTHLRAHETVLDLVCRLLLEKKKKPTTSLSYSPTHLLSLLLLPQCIFLPLIPHLISTFVRQHVLSLYTLC